MGVCDCITRSLSAGTRPRQNGMGDPARFTRARSGPGRKILLQPPRWTVRSEIAPFLASVVGLRPPDAAPSTAPLPDHEVPAGAPAAEPPEAGMDLAAAEEWRL